jgi:prolyl oligopeptidase
MKSVIAILCLVSAAPVLAVPLERPAPPPVKPVTEDYFGTRITDNYRYMEDSADPVFSQWIRAEGRYARSFFDSIAPRAELAKRVSAFGGSFGFVNSYQSYGGRDFWLERAPGSDNFDLMVQDSAGKRKLVDVEALRAKHGGKPAAINYYAASPDGSKVAVGISEGGSEKAAMSVFDVKTGAAIAGPLDRIQFGPPSWSDDGKLILTNRLAQLGPKDPPSKRYVNSTGIVWDLHNAPRPVTGGEASTSVIKVDPVQFSLPASIPGSPVYLAAVINGVQNELEFWTAPKSQELTVATPWKPLVTRADDVTSAQVRGDTIYLLTHHDAPTFKVLSLKVGQPLSSAREAVPSEPGRLIEAITAASDGLYVVAREGLYSRLFRLTDAGAVEPIQLPAKGSIDPTNVFADPRKPGVSFLFDNWTMPPAMLAYDPATGQFADRKLGIVPASYDAAAFRALDLDAPAKDGTKVPFSVIARAKASGPQPMLIMAYGSYGISNFPYFSSRSMAVLNEGISYGVCHVRGGGELGEQWRVGGKDAAKPNTWRDLIACAEKAVADKLTTPRQLFIIGGSAGGIPMGMAPVERPDLFAGVIDQVPMASALRAEFQTNGPANIPEFGTIKTEDGFRNLLAMDGYQHLRDGVVYPPVLITTGLNDPRVDSWQPAKLAARMIAANPNNVVVLRVDEEAGHGIGSTKSQTDELYADIIAFINWRLGKPGWSPAGSGTQH